MGKAIGNGGCSVQFSFSLPCLGFAELFESVNISFTKFGKSLAIIFFQLFSSMSIFLCSLKNYNDMNVRLIFHRSQRLYSLFFKHFSLCSSD